MAFNHSKLTVFWLDNAAGALQNLSTYINSVSLSQELEEVETTTFGATDRTFLTGFRDGTISIEGFWDPTLGTHMNALMAAFQDGSVLTATFEYGPAGDSTGSQKFSGEAILTSYEKSNEIGDATAWSAELRVSGGVTAGTW